MQDGRRRLLKTLTLCGSVVTVTKLPTTWRKPVVEAIALPVHAQLTGLCVIQVSLSMELEGNWTGEGGFFIWNSSQCFAREELTGPFNRSFSYPGLEPGTYYFDGGGGFGGGDGAGDLLVQVVCCDRREQVMLTLSGEGGDEEGMTLMITIRDDGTCDISRIDRTEPTPCLS